MVSLQYIFAFTCSVTGSVKILKLSDDLIFRNCISFEKQPTTRLIFDELIRQYKRFLIYIQELMKIGLSFYFCDSLRKLLKCSTSLISINAIFWFLFRSLEQGRLLVLDFFL